MSGMRMKKIVEESELLDFQAKAQHHFEEEHG